MKKVVLFIFLCLLSLSVFAQQETVKEVTARSSTTDYEVTVEVVRLDEFGNVVQHDTYYLEVDFLNTSSSIQFVYYEALNKKTSSAMGVSSGQARLLKNSEEAFRAFLQSIFERAGLVRYYKMREIHKKV